MAQKASSIRPKIASQRRKRGIDEIGRDPAIDHGYVQDYGQGQEWGQGQGQGQGQDYGQGQGWGQDNRQNEYISGYRDDSDQDHNINYLDGERRQGQGQGQGQGHRQGQRQGQGQGQGHRQGQRQGQGILDFNEDYSDNQIWERGEDRDRGRDRNRERASRGDTNYYNVLLETERGGISDDDEEERDGDNDDDDEEEGFQFIYAQGDSSYYKHRIVTGRNLI